MSNKAGENRNSDPYGGSDRLVELVIAHGRQQMIGQEHTNDPSLSESDHVHQCKQCRRTCGGMRSGFEYEDLCQHIGGHHTRQVSKSDGRREIYKGVVDKSTGEVHTSRYTSGSSSLYHPCDVAPHLDALRDATVLWVVVRRVRHEQSFYRECYGRQGIQVSRPANRLRIP